MTYFLTPTQQEYNAAYMVSEQLRHERLTHQNSIICEIELTPAGEPIPLMTMSRYRQQQLDAEVERCRRVLDIMNADEDFIPM